MSKSWSEKFEAAKPPHVKRLDKAFAGLPPGARLLISSPRAIADYMAAVPRGETRTIEAMRAALAAHAQADGTCPLTTGIFARIAAEAAAEAIEAGKTPSAVTPFWRVIDPDSPLARKLAAGPDFIRQQRAAESAKKR